MTRPQHTLLGLITIASTAIYNTAALAAQNVYQVELIVFERTAVGSDEQWPKNLTLEYPGRWQRLFDPIAEAAREADAEAAAEQTNALRLSDDFLRTLANEAADRGAPTAAADTPSNAAGTSPENSDTQVTTADDTQKEPAFFAFLPPQQRTLDKTRTALDRSNQLRVVFHETWRQPLTALEKSPALILHGGNQYGTNYELQGYIQLGISRYLHLQTNLWFTHFAPNRGQTSEHWPKLPPEPIALSGEESDAPRSVGTDNGPDVFDERTGSTFDFTGWGSSAATDPYGDLLQAPYIINRIVTLQQKRRMRSGELHYIDHPQLGLLIKFTPI